jgi:hypothetical protein
VHYDFLAISSKNTQNPTNDAASFGTSSTKKMHSKNFLVDLDFPRETKLPGDNVSQSTFPWPEFKKDGNKNSNCANLALHFSDV